MEENIIKDFSMSSIVIKIAMIVIFALCSSISIIAGPPFLTDDPQPVDYKHWEFYIASQDAFGKSSGGGTLPHFEVNFGPVENVQLHLVVPLGYNYAAGGLFNYGLSDIEIGVKYRFVEEVGFTPQIGIFPLIELPSGDKNKGLGNGKVQVFLPVWFQKSIAEWTSYGGAGYWYNPGEGNKNWVFAGWLIQRDFSKFLTLGGEIYYKTANTIDAKSTIGFNFGGYLNLGDMQHIIFSAGKAFSADNNVTAYLGLLFTI